MDRKIEELLVEIRGLLAEMLDKLDERCADEEYDEYDEDYEYDDHYYEDDEYYEEDYAERYHHGSKSDWIENFDGEIPDEEDAFVVGSAWMREEFDNGYNDYDDYNDYNDYNDYDDYDDYGADYYDDF